MTTIISSQRTQLNIHSAALVDPITSQASCLFLSNFVLVAPQGTNRGYNEFILTLLDAAPVGSPFLSAFRACSLAFLNNHRRCTGEVLEIHTLRLYTSAMTATALALQNTKTANDDATLGAILLLLLFEVITSRDMQIPFWRTHLEGAMQLIQARGRAQLFTKTGISLFTAVRTQMVSQYRLTSLLSYSYC